MAEKGETKILALILISIILISILFAGCINNNGNNDSNKYKLADHNELELKIMMENPKLSFNTSNINISVKLTNIMDYKIYVENAFSIGTTLKIHLLSPLNNSLENSITHYDYERNTVSLSSGEFKQYSFNLMNFIFYNISNGKPSEYNWNEIGVYTLYLSYIITEPDLISNIEKFEIV